MKHPNSAREALIAEALGDVATLLDRIDRLLPALDQSRQAMVDAGAGLSDQLAEFEAKTAWITQTARTHVVQHVVGRIEEATRHASERHNKAMKEAAHELFRTEVDQALQRLVASVDRLRADEPHPWEPWLTHAATATAAAAVTWAVMTWLGG